MRKVLHFICLSTMFVILFALSGCSQGSTTLSGDYNAYLQGEDWGESISRITLHVDKNVDSNTVSGEDFTISETKQAFDWSHADKGIYKTTSKRTILSAYTSDKKGNKIKKSSKYITIEMQISPTEGRYFLVSPDSPSSQYPKLYKLNIGLSKKGKLTAGGSSVSNLAIKQTINKLTTSADQFKVTAYKASDGVDYKYAYYEPETKSDTLVVWLHGLLEGGKDNTDPYISLLGNEAANLGKSDFQDAIGGANILVPQSPSFWMDKTGSDSLVDGKIVSDGTSYYTKLLHELIAYYKEKTGSKKVVIAGCSNGGYMGMILAREYGSEYDAYMLICEAMENQYVTDDDIQKLKDLPLYFIYSKDDPLVIPDDNEVPTIERLRAAGATNVHTTVFDTVENKDGKILDSEGKPYNFGGHSSWVYFFNNEAKDDSSGISSWQWIAQQLK